MHSIGFRGVSLAAGETAIPRLDLALEHPFEAPRDLPFLIALSAGSQPPGILCRL